MRLVSESPGGLTRRQFVRLGTAAALGSQAILHGEALTAAPQSSMRRVAFTAREPRIAIIGTGGRGTSLLGDLLVAGGRVVALCDIVQPKAEGAADMVVKAGQHRPEIYTHDDHDYERLLERRDIDLVIVATPWSWHAPMASFAMKAEKDVAIEVPGVVTLDECWSIVNTSEQTRKHCMMLENCCYGYNETLVLRMIHAGLFGDLLYGEGAYLHDLREELFSQKGEGLWRRTEHTLRDGNLYPTHGLSPVANYMGIQRGDRFGRIVSMSSRHLGLEQYRKAHVPADDPRQKEIYRTGDMNVSIIQTANGLTITVKHAVSTPRPYDRINQIAGTKGIFQDYPPRIYFDGMNANEAFEGIDKFQEYQHPLWKDEGEKAREHGGHGGMDYIMLYRLLECVRKGLPPDMDVYDAAACSSVGPLSTLSISRGSAPVEFPDFLRDAWKDPTPVAIATQG
ncbi:MAG TPA: Gfo/Idh/MocA family oxidoreductase [Terracidiphilus sp.]|jgi:predicted dehydrogenase